jgi:hypothetical protein
MARSKEVVRTVRVRKQWAARIRRDYDGTVNAFLKLGRTLIAARKALPHGEFEQMIERDLPFTPSTAQRLMKIAGDRGLVKAAHAQLLPLAWTAAYELTKLDRSAFDQALAAGAIYPKMTRENAKTLRKYRTRKVRKALRLRHRPQCPIITNNCNYAHVQTQPAAGNPCRVASEHKHPT